MQVQTIIKNTDHRRMEALNQGFSQAFGYQPERYFSAPGRTEICGNHTDHQRGRVLAAAVDLDAMAAAAENGTEVLRVQSEGYPRCEISLRELGIRKDEKNTTPALIRGVAARFVELGWKLRGLDLYISSQVLPGSGLSSSAAFEVLVGAVLNGMFCGGKISDPEIAQIAQYAENVYFGKPSGLMDQMASSVGNLVEIDFGDTAHPEITPLDFDFSATGYALCIIDSQASHADLTDEYTAIPVEMKAVAAYFGKEVLSQVPEAEFYAAIPALRQQCGDRAVLRAFHFYQENKRVPRACEALRRGDFQGFLEVLRQSGYSSYMYLQNVTPAGDVAHQDMAVTLALCEQLLEGEGSYRVHGGGFAGTCQAFVPLEKLERFRNGIDGALGQGACHVLSIRAVGGAEVRA